jgi:hypothetical protein
MLNFLSKLLGVAKGWKQVAVGLLFVVFGFLQSEKFRDAVGGCVFDVSAAQPDTCVLPSWSIFIIAGIIIVLRFLTTTPIFRSGKDKITEEPKVE